MPELVDVEMVRRKLLRWMKGARVVAVHATDRYVLRPASPATFRHALAGRTVRGVERRGKWLRVELDGDLRLFSHLGMTGDWALCAVGAPRMPSERARLDLVRGGAATALRYLDPRRFGRLVAARREIPEWCALGQDPLTDGLTERSLRRSLATSHRAVKERLMDQTALAGIGNVLATEALWIARIHPRARSNSLTAVEVRAIVRALWTAIRRELRDKPEGVERRRAYGRAGRSCPRCGKTFARIVLGGRTTVLCRRCQAPRHSARGAGRA
jgi:formamidopyrimidine-DNA glycosylase